MKKFKSLAEFKRLINEGVKLKGYRFENDQKIDLGVREVSISQTNCFALKTKRTDGKIVDSWVMYPKASMTKIVDNNEIQIYMRGKNDVPKLSLAYQIIET